MPSSNPIITSVEIYQSKIKLKEPFIISLGVLTHAENIIVRIRTDNGISGFGECSPFRSINGESMETCFVVGQYFAHELKGKNPLDIAACTSIMNKLIYANNSIKSAFDMALHDIAAQDAGLPLFAFLGGKNDKRIVTDYTVSFDTPQKMAADAGKIIANGFQIIKVKLGGTKNEDIQRIDGIRKEVGMDIPIRIDANQGWDTVTAIEILKALLPCNIQHCEEPVPRWNFMELPYIRQHSPIKIMADESCCDEHDASRLVALQACDYFNVKLGKSGGIFRAKKIMDIAEQHNIAIQLGGFLESRLGFTAATHLALCSKQIVHFDFDTPLMFEADPVIGGITYNKKGEVFLPGGQGLGASFDEAYLKGLPSFILQ